jgi:hypothetical protein
MYENIIITPHEGNTTHQGNSHHLFNCSSTFNSGHGRRLYWLAGAIVRSGTCSLF